MTRKKKNYKDSEGVIYKHPERTCKDCDCYPCFIGIDSLSCDFAKYGCREYKDNKREVSNL